MALRLSLDNIYVKLELKPKEQTILSKRLAVYEERNLFKRIWNAILHLFGQSAWQKAVKSLIPKWQKKFSTENKKITKQHVEDALKYIIQEKCIKNAPFFAPWGKDKWSLIRSQESFYQSLTALTTT